MIDLQKILTDISTQNLQPSDLEKAFDEVATILLRQTKIVTKKKAFYFREIEIYFYNQETHPDPYTHKRPRQSQFGEWYFHRFLDIEPFLKSNRNGLDITFGNEEQDIFGGILIRKIQETKTSELIVGINKVARSIIDNVGSENINEIALGSGQKVFDNNERLHLEVEGNNYTTAIFKTQRNGLSFREDELSRTYYKIPYCYYNHNLNVAQIIEVRPAI
jgi:hypothetical protein